MAGESVGRKNQRAEGVDRIKLAPDSFSNPGNRGYEPTASQPEYLKVNQPVAGGGNAVAQAIGAALNTVYQNNQTNPAGKSGEGRS